MYLRQKINTQKFFHTFSTRILAIAKPRAIVVNVKEWTAAESKSQAYAHLQWYPSETRNANYRRLSVLYYILQRQI